MSKPSGYDLYLFHRGRHFRSFELFGAHIVLEGGSEGVRFTLWAPNAKKVSVIGSFNDWSGDMHSLKRIEKSGVWTLFIPEVKEGALYKYEIITEDDKRLVKSDPYAFYAEVQPKTASIVYDLDGFDWQHSFLNKNDCSTEETVKEEQDSLSFCQEPMLIYEVHLGSWMRSKDGGYLSYRELADKLINYVTDMGFTHIELLPLNEHPFDGSWGYQTTGYYAVTSRYGTPQDFMYFVDCCHEEGLGVIMDWTPGHFCRDAHGLAQFDGTALYESEDPRRAENEWGSLNFDFHQPEVLSFLISNALFFFEYFRIDGLRVDAVSNMLYLDHGKEEGQWAPNKYGGNENLAAIDFIKKLNSTVLSTFPEVLMIAEESTAWPLVTSPPYAGGLGFNYKWNMGWMNDMLSYMQKDPVFRKWNHEKITFSFMYAFSENYILPLSHDEVVHSKDSLIAKMPGDYWQKFANLRLLYGYMLAHPGKKLLFMGGEFAQFNEWNHNTELDWFLKEDYPMHQKFNEFVRKINHVYQSCCPLWNQDHLQEGFDWIDPNNSDQSIITFIRREDEENYILVLCNFTPVVYENYRIGVPELKKYHEVFNSDDVGFGGSGQINEGTFNALDREWNNQPFQIEIKVPPLAVVFIEPV